MSETLAARAHTAFKRLEDYTLWFYGPPKVGKTSTALSLYGPGQTLLIATEKGYAALDVPAVVDVKSWQDFVAVKNALLENPGKYKAVIIDTIDRLHKLCQFYICKRHAMDYPSDMKVGKGWGLITNEFRKEVAPLTQEEFAVAFISHQTLERSDNPKASANSLKRIPAISGAPGGMVRELANFEFYMTVATKLPPGVTFDNQEQLDKVELLEHRVLLTRPTALAEVGGHFNFDEAQVDLGSSPLEGANNLRAAFERALARETNKLTNT